MLEVVTAVLRPLAKKRFLSQKDLIKGFSRSEVKIGQNDLGVYILSTYIHKNKCGVPLLLLCNDGDPALIKRSIDETFASVDAGEGSVDLGPSDWDLRENAKEGPYAGYIHIFLTEDREPLAFCFLSGKGYRVGLNQKRALNVFIRIIETKLAHFTRSG